MRVNGGSDLARLQMLQKQAFATRNKLDVAGQELTTNLKASRYDATGGNLTRLFALERSLERNEVFTQTISLTELRLDVMQESLGRILTPAQDLSIDLIQTVSQGDYASAMLHANAARRASPIPWASSIPRSPASRSSPGRPPTARRWRPRTRSSPISTP